MRRALGASFVALASSLVAAGASAQSPMQKVHLVRAETLASLAWIALADDPGGDVLQPRLPDARQLSYAIDANADLIWFKVVVREPLPERWFGVSVAFDTDDEPDNGATWWGTNKTKFDRLASAFLFKADDGWQGYVGVGDSESVSRGYMTNVTRDVRVARDAAQRAILLGVPRAALGSRPTARVMATVGSMLANNDDVPNEGMITVKVRP